MIDLESVNKKSINPFKTYDDTVSPGWTLELINIIGLLCNWEGSVKVKQFI